jgi:hypothetical protein
MSLNTLLSLDPADEELRTDGKFSEATKAIFERGVGIPATSCPQKGSHSRLRHPFPDSLGGRRRVVNSSSNASRAPSAPSPTDLLLALPPKPTCKERRRQKKIPVLGPSFAASSRADSAIRRVLNQFSLAASKSGDQVEFRPRKQRITEIAFMHGVQLNKQASSKAKTGGNSRTGGSPMKDCATQDIDHILALNVLHAVGIVASTIRDNDVKNFDFQASFKIPLFDEGRMRSLGLPVDVGAIGQSISKVNKARKNFSSTKRSFTDAFFSERAPKYGGYGKVIAAKDNESVMVQLRDQIVQPPSTASTAVVNLRGGGGDGGVGSCEGGKKSNRNAEPAVEIGPGGSSFRGPQSDNSHNMNSSMNSSIRRDLSSHRVVWDERSQQLLVQAPLVRNGSVLQSPGAQFQAQRHQAEHYHQTSALQLAHQLRISRLPPHGPQTTGDLSDYIGGLHQQQAQAAYDWSSVGAASAAAAVASSHSLAALGLNPHRSAIVPLTVQDRTRALLAREQRTFAAHAAAAQHQQAVALLGGTGGAPVHTYAAPGYPHLAGQLLNPSNAALLGHPGIQRLRFAGATQAASNNSPSLANTIQTVQKSSDFVHSVLNQNGQNSQDGKPNSDVVQKPAFGHDKEINENGRKSTEGQNDDKILPSESAKKRKRVDYDLGDECPADKKPGVSNLENVNKSLIPSIVRDESEPSKHLDKDDASQAAIDKKIVGENLKGVDDSFILSHGKQNGLQFPPKLSGDLTLDDSQSKVTSCGLQYFVPAAPVGISSDVATLILSAKCHEAIQILGFPQEFGAEASQLVEYIVSVGTAVPIPKTMVLNFVKDRMNAPAFKNGGVCNFPALSRDVIVAVILLWLWRNQEDSFQRAFSKSGRIDVDPECKWFVTAAVDRAVSALAAEVTEPSSRSGKPLATALLAHKNKNSAAQKGGETDAFSTTSTRIDLLAAAIVNKALNSGLAIDEEKVSYSSFFDYFFQSGTGLSTYQFPFSEFSRRPLPRSHRIS